MTQAEMQRCESAHRQSDNMCLSRADVIEHGQNIIGGTGLRVGGDVLRYVRRRETPSIKGDGAITLSEMAHLQLVAAQVAGEFMHEDYGMPGARFLEIQSHPVVRRCVRHDGLLRPSSTCSIVVKGRGEPPACSAADKFHSPSRLPGLRHRPR